MFSTPDFTWLFIKMVIGLVIVCGLAFFLLRYVLPRTSLGRMRGKNWIQVLDRFPLDQHSCLYVVKIAQQHFVLGTSNHSVTKIAELTPSELGLTSKAVEEPELKIESPEGESQ